MAIELIKAKPNLDTKDKNGVTAMISGIFSLIT
jgi:hypothetical protein